MKKILKEDVIGKTVNLYYDQKETILAGQFRIMSIIPHPSNMWIVLKPTYYLQKDKGTTWLNTFINWVGDFISNFETIYMSTSCGKKEFYIQSEKNKKNFNKPLYNSELSKDLTKEICAKSKGKDYVPDADYKAPMPEGKKVIKLSESDLVKIVRRIIKEQELDRELPRLSKGILGHKDRWYDEEDREINPDEFDYDEEIEFGPDDFEDYISHTETDFPENKWSFGQKGRKGDRTPGKGYWDRYQKHGAIKLRKKRF